LYMVWNPRSAAGGRDGGVLSLYPQGSVKKSAKMFDFS
jgi:hypothetical protein